MVILQTKLRSKATLCFSHRNSTFYDNRHQSCEEKNRAEGERSDTRAHIPIYVLKITLSGKWK